jgi:hypothetical protein
MQGVVYKDQVVPVSIEVVDGRTQGTWWDPKTHPKNIRDRKGIIRAGIIHHQAGEGDAKAVYNVLSKRESGEGKFVYLSVHFEIDHKGVITQLCDLDHCAQHAGDANEWTWGVEIANLGTGKASKNHPREFYVDHMHGRSMGFLAFYDEQKFAACNLCREVHKILGLSLDIPKGPTGKSVRGVLTDEELGTWRGILAHYMITTRKIDPSPDMMDYLVSCF